MTRFDAIRTRLRDMLRAYPFVSGFLATILLFAPLVCCVILFVVGTTLYQSSKAQPDASPVSLATSVISGTIDIPSPTPSPTPTLVTQTSSPVPSFTSTPTAYPLPTRAAPPTSSPYPVAPPTRQQPTSMGYPTPSRPTPIQQTGYPTPSRPTPIVATSYPAPSPQTVQPTATVAQIPTPDLSEVLESSGIGLDRVIWEKTQGASVETDAGYSYKDGAFLVEFEDDAIWYLKRMWGDKDALPIEEARDFATRFIPDDSDLVEFGELEGTTVIDWYHSEWLKEQFVSSENIWADSAPGDFTITYTVEDGRAVSFVITPGNSP